MSPSITTIEEIDLEISVAYIRLGGVRSSWERAPTPENAWRVDEAQAEVDRLLDERFRAQS